MTVLGWITICAGLVTVPVAGVPRAPYMAFPTESACLEANKQAQAVVLMVLAKVGRTKEAREGLTCWCEPVVPAGGDLRTPAGSR